jgi:hypothetical protein
MTMRWNVSTQHLQAAVGFSADSPQGGYPAMDETVQDG